MGDSNKVVNLEGTDYISNINPIYYSTVGGIVDKFVDKSAASMIAKTTLPGGTVIASTINLIKDPDNPGKVIVSTVAASGITYMLSAAFSDIAVAATELTIGAALAAAGVVVSPIVVSVAAVVGVAVGTTMLGNKIQSVLYDALSEFENFDFYSPEIYGTVTKEEFMLQEMKNDPYFCMRMFPKYLRYRQITTIKNFNFNSVVDNAACRRLRAA